MVASPSSSASRTLGNVVAATLVVLMTAGVAAADGVHEGTWIVTVIGPDEIYTNGTSSRQYIVFTVCNNDVTAGDVLVFTKVLNVYTGLAVGRCRTWSLVLKSDDSISVAAMATGYVARGTYKVQVLDK